MSRDALSMGTRMTRSGLRWKSALAPRSPRSSARSRKLELGKIAGAPSVERVDRLVQTIAAGRGMRSDAVDEIVALVDSKLEANARVAV